MSAALPPKPWRVEPQGLIAAMAFTHPDGRELLWCDGRWLLTIKRGSQGFSVPAPGVPAASSMAEARVSGCEFLWRIERGE